MCYMNSRASLITSCTSVDVMWCVDRCVIFQGVYTAALCYKMCSQLWCITLCCVTRYVDSFMTLHDVWTGVLCYKMCSQLWYRVCRQLCCSTCVEHCKQLCSITRCIDKCVVLQDVLQGVLCYRNSRVSSSVTDSPTSCSQNICRSTTLTRCSVRQTTTCRPRTVASLSMSSGNSTMTSCQITATMLPPAGE